MDNETNLYKNSNYWKTIFNKSLDYIDKNKLIDDIIYYKSLTTHNNESNQLLEYNINRLKNILQNYELLLKTTPNK